MIKKTLFVYNSLNLFHILNEIKENCNVSIEEIIVAEEKVVFKIPKELNFTWGNNSHTMWHINAIYHNAGVTEEREGMPFYKANYMNSPPIVAPKPNNNWASLEYFNLVVESWNKTEELTKKQIVRKRV